MLKVAASILEQQEREEYLAHLAAADSLHALDSTAQLLSSCPATARVAMEEDG